MQMLASCAALSLLGPGVYALDNILPIEEAPVTGPTQAGATRAA
jgi:hypothetical protein